MNPYEVLGVQPTDDLATIKKTYRSLSKKHHPDQGGTTEKMAELVWAWGILSDPEKRKRYDETGSADEKDNNGEMAVAFAQMVESIFFERENKNTKKCIELFQANLTRVYNENQETIKAKRANLELVRARIKKAPDLDLLGGIIANNLRQLKASEEKNEQDMKAHQKALDLLKEYVFTEPAEHPGFGNGTGTHQRASFFTIKMN